MAALALAAGAGSWMARADEPVSSSVRYNREIVRIFQRKCVACHGPAGLAMPLDRYHDVRPWARAIREEILERRMPPWPAAPGVRPLANELALTTREIAIITSWIDGGTPRGDPWELPASPPQETWRMGRPEVTLALPPQEVKSDGSPQMRRVKVSTGLERERWLQGFDVAPGERRALRSLFVYLQSPAGAPQWLGGWTPWYSMRHAPNNVGFRIPAGASLEIEMHYAAWTDDERPLLDRSTLGLYFLAERPPAEAKTLTVTAAGTARALRGDAVLNDDTMVWAVRPRFDRDQKAQPGAIEMRAITPAGVVEPIVWIKDHREDWQLPYVLREPLHLPRGSRLVLSAHGESGGGAMAVASLLTFQGAVGTPTASTVNDVVETVPRRLNWVHRR